MKLIILLFILFSNFAFGASKIVDYRFGNQIKGSILSIYEDGTIHRTERKGPVHIEELPAEVLTNEALALLLQYIDVISSSSQARTAVGQSGAGSYSGYLYVFKNDVKINVRSIEFGNLDGSPQPIMFNVAPEARLIEDLVFNMVLRPMSF